MNDWVRADEAARALDEIQQRQEQVINLALVPDWYWWAIGALMVGLSASVDSHQRIAIGIGVSVFVLGVLIATGWVAAGSLRAQVRNDLLGPTGVLSILGLVALVIAVTLPLAFGLRAAHIGYPATIGASAGAVVLIIGGPVLMRRLRRIMLDNRSASRAGGR
jgi:hypothetical protein